MPKRRRGARSAFARRRLADSRFEELVERALDGIPEPFRAALEEVAIVIEDDATEEQLEISGLGRDDALYGLYEGTPRTAWGADLVPFPNKISLFRIPLVGLATSSFTVEGKEPGSVLKLGKSLGDAGPYVAAEEAKTIRVLVGRAKFRIRRKLSTLSCTCSN
jgi:predicted Zn-dependent protease with MMP-like domain